MAPEGSPCESLRVDLGEVVAQLGRLARGRRRRTLQTQLTRSVFGDVLRDLGLPSLEGARFSAVVTELDEGQRRLLDLLVRAVAAPPMGAAFAARVREAGAAAAFEFALVPLARGLGHLTLDEIGEVPRRAEEVARALVAELGAVPRGEDPADAAARGAALDSAASRALARRFMKELRPGGDEDPDATDP